MIGGEQGGEEGFIAREDPQVSISCADSTVGLVVISRSVQVP